MTMPGKIVPIGQLPSVQPSQTIAWEEWISASSAPVISGGDGCVAVLGPVPSGQTWHVIGVRVKVLQTNGAVWTGAEYLEVYRNDASVPMNTIDSSPNGQNDFETFPWPGAYLTAGDSFIYVWADQTVGTGNGLPQGAVGILNAQVSIEQS